MDTEKHRNNRNIDNENVSTEMINNTCTLFLNNVVEKIKNKLCSKVIKQIAPVKVFTLLI